MKEDFYNVLIVYSGILAPILIYGNKIKIDSKIIILISSFYFLMILYFLLNGTITLGNKNSIYSIIQMLGMFFPLLLFQCTRNKFLNIPNHKLFFLILVILFYETFIAFTRMNIIGIILSSIFIFLLTKTKNNFSFNIHFIKNLSIFFFLLGISVPIMLLLRTGFVDRTYSDSFRLFEAVYLYQDYISNHIFLGYGFGKTFITPLTNEVETAAHIGLITILLKFGFLGLIILLIIILKPMFMFIFHTDLKKLNSNNWIVLISPALLFWVISFTTGKGTFPEQLFGLGLSIGSYIQFNNSMHYLNNNIYKYGNIR